MKLVPDEIDFSAYEAGDELHRILPASTWVQKVFERIHPGDPKTVGLSMPWAKVDSFRLRPHEVTCWFGINGHGKSTLLSQIMLHALMQDEPVVVASMEMTPWATMARMVRQAAGNDRPPEKYIKAMHRWTDGRLWIYDRLGMVEPHKMLAVIRYCLDKIKPRHFVIDSLMKCGMSPDDYGGQKRFVDCLCGIALESGLHIHLVAHARKGDRETDRLDKFDIKGTSEIADQVDNIVAIERNKRKEKAKTPAPDEPDAFVTVIKQRHGDWEGTAGFWYHRPSMTYLPAKTSSPWSFDFPEMQVTS